MFSIHRKLSLALKKIRFNKITPPQVPFTWQKNSLPSKLLPLFGKPCTSEWHKLSRSIKVCVSDKIIRIFKQKIFPWMAKTKTKGKTRQSFKFQNLTKSKKREILMIFSLTQCNSYIIIYQFQLWKSKREKS